MHRLGPTWRHLSAPLASLAALARSLRAFYHIEHICSIVARLGANLAHLGAILGHPGAKKCQDGAKIPQDDAKTCQDGAPQIKKSLVFHWFYNVF